MKFELEVGGRFRSVELKRQTHGYEVIVDGRSRWVDAVHVAGSAWSLLVREPGEPNSRSVDAAVIRRAASASFDVHINGFHFEVRPSPGLGRTARGAGAHASSGHGPQRITSPMPGKVVRVLVKAGDAVADRQALCVVEAMKMENELRAGRDGRVKDVLVSEGQSVEAGAPMIVIE